MMELQFRRPDGTFVAILNGMPYHIVEDDELFEAAQEFADEMGEDLPFEPVPEPEDPGEEPLRPLSPRQLLIAALSIDITEDDILTMIDAIDDDQTRAIARIEWAKAKTYDRNHWLVEELRVAMDFDAAEFDALWLWAASI
jgi:hypothetical protein